jgi:hypothetical protein
MWLTRYAVPLALVVAVLLACFAPRAPERSSSITARELLAAAQAESGASYTYSRATGAALATTRLARPEEGADRAALEAALVAAGFRLEPLGGEHELFRVEPAAP